MICIQCNGSLSGEQEGDKEVTERFIPILTNKLYCVWGDDGNNPKWDNC